MLKVLQSFGIVIIFAIIYNQNDMFIINSVFYWRWSMCPCKQ